MNRTDIESKILSFLQKHPLCVIATLHEDGSGPESAVIGFAETDKLEIVFGTSNTSRKYKNIQKNNNVSFVIGWDSRVGTVQYEGVAQEIPLEDVEKYREIQIQKNPYSEKYAKRDDQRYFLVKPTWIRLVDNTVSPPDTYELTF